MNEPLKLRSPTYAESVALENYKTAMGTALSSADALADKIVTAAFSIGTAYGAAIALVAPKDAQSTFEVVLPFAAIAVAVGLALFAQSRSISLDETNELATIRENIKGTVGAKRLWGRLALVALVAGVILAGWVLHETYGPGAKKDTSSSVTIGLTPAGSKLVKQVCGPRSGTVLRGKASGSESFSSARATVTVGAGTCPNAPGKLVLPRSAIGVVTRK